MTHRNAPLTPQGRYRLVMRVQAGRPIAHVAAEAGIARATLSKWVARYRQGGTEALEDRSSAPAHRPTQTSAETVDLIEHWRRTHKWSARRISHELAVRGTVVSARTVTRWLDSVKPRVLWRLVYLVPVVAGCDCSWRWVSGAQAASCSAGVRIPMAECGRVVPVPVDPLGGGEHGRCRCPPKGPGQRMSSALYSELSASARAKPKGIALRAYRGDCLAVGQGLPIANGPVLHPTVASGAPGPSGRPPDVSAARRPSEGRPGPGWCAGQ